MKTNRTILAASIAALLTTAGFAAESASSSVTVNTKGDGKGKAVITIDVNGKKETREIDLGNATSIEIRTDTPVEKKRERVGYLGVAMAQMPTALADQLGLEPEVGVVVGSVVPGGPAEKAGLQKNDVLVRVGDAPVKDMRQVQDLVAAHKEGDKITLHYFRRAQAGSAEVTLGSEERGDDGYLNLPEKWKPVAGQWLQDAIGKGFGISRRAIIVGPDGKVIEQADPAKQMRNAAESVERALRDAKIGEKTLDAVRDALNDAVKALDTASDPNANPAEAGEIARRATKEAQEKAEQIRREVEQRVRKELNLRHPDASKVPERPLPLEKE